LKKEVNADVINSKKEIWVKDLLDIVRYAAIAVLCIFVLGLFFLLGWKLWL